MSSSEIAHLGGKGQLIARQSEYFPCPWLRWQLLHLRVEQTGLQLTVRLQGGV